MPLFYQKLPDNTIFLCIISRVPHYKIFHVKNKFQSQKITIKNSGLQSDGYFISRQDNIDIRNAKIELALQLEEIKTYTYA